jgi:hypothetical protein
MKDAIETVNHTRNFKHKNENKVSKAWLHLFLSMLAS